MRVLFLILIYCIAQLSACAQNIGIPGANIVLISTGQPGIFTFNLDEGATTSAGVYKTDGTLVRTLWTTQYYSSGSHQGFWDGKDDLNNEIGMPDGSYVVKILSSNVQYEWEGVIGNTSTNLTGSSIHKGWYYFATDIEIVGDYGYYVTGFSEGSPSPNFFDEYTGGSDSVSDDPVQDI